MKVYPKLELKFCSPILSNLISVSKLVQIAHVSISQAPLYRNTTTKDKSIVNQEKAGDYFVQISIKGF